MNTEDIKKQIDEIKVGLLDNVKKEAQEAMKTQIEALEQKLEDATKGNLSKEEFDKQVEKMQTEITTLSAELNKHMQKNNKGEKIDATNPKMNIVAMSKAFEALLIEKKEDIKTGHLGATEKAVTTASFGSGGWATINTDNTLPVDVKPYAPVYLRTLFPNITTSNNFLRIWKKGAVTGAAAIWERGKGTGGADTNKPEVTPTWGSETVAVDWIAGLTHVQQEVLDDIDFIRTEIPQTLVYSAEGILAAENKMILDYIQDKAVDFTKDTEFEIGVEKVLAAAFGQLRGAYLNPSHILINRWDYLTYLQFNKAGGSGEYDLPNTSIQFISGQMYINGLIAVPVPELDAGEAYVIAADRSRFVNRQSIQLKVSEEHGDNFAKNMVTFRAEERVGFFTYDNNSFVKVSLPSTVVDGE